MNFTEFPRVRVPVTAREQRRVEARLEGVLLIAESLVFPQSKPRRQSCQLAVTVSAILEHASRRLRAVFQRHSSARVTVVWVQPTSGREHP